MQTTYCSIFILIVSKNVTNSFNQGTLLFQVVVVTRSSYFPISFTLIRFIYSLIIQSSYLLMNKLSKAATSSVRLVEMIRPIHCTNLLVPVFKEQLKVTEYKKVHSINFRVWKFLIIEQLFIDFTYSKINICCYVNVSG